MLKNIKIKYPIIKSDRMRFRGPMESLKYQNFINNIKHNVKKITMYFNEEHKRVSSVIENNNKNNLNDSIIINNKEYNIKNLSLKKNKLYIELGDIRRQ